MLDPQRNPLLRGRVDLTFFTVSRRGEPVGRIVAHIDTKSNQLHALRRSCFGYFDCQDDGDAAALLLGAAEQWGRERGCTEIAGNFELTAMQQIGVTTDGFAAAPHTDMHYNPAHVPRLLEAHGYERWFPMTTFETDLTRFDPDTLLGPAQRAILESSRLRFDTVERRRFRAQLEDVRLVLNDGFAENPLFVPLTHDEFFAQSEEMLWIMDPRIACLVYEHDRPIGAVVCIPDLNPFLRSTRSRIGWSTPLHFVRHRLRRERAVIIFYSVCRESHGRGLAGAMLYRVTVALRSSGYRRLGTTWISDSNLASLRQMEKLGAEPLHRLHLFRKPLTAEGSR